MSLRFLRAAMIEAEAAALWYEARREGLGADFIAELMKRARRAEELPGAGRLEPDAPPELDLRWYLLKRFPYGLLVGSSGRGRIVVAVAHERRRPGYWKRRVGDL